MSPKKLTDTQLVLLSAAAQREDGAIDLAGDPKGSCCQESHQQAPDRWIG